MGPIAQFIEAGREARSRGLTLVPEPTLTEAAAVGGAGVILIRLELGPERVAKEIRQIIEPMKKLA